MEENIGSTYFDFFDNNSIIVCTNIICSIRSYHSAYQAHTLIYQGSIFDSKWRFKKKDFLKTC